MSKKLQTFGDRPAKYRCWLNPYDFTRASSCPRCEKPTYPRKFPLVIATEGTTAPIVLGLTCKYCSKCELIVAHKNIIESFLYQHFCQHQPEVIGNDFFIVATMELAYWNKVKDTPGPFAEFIPHMADIKEHLFYNCQPAGWYRNEE